MLKCPHCSQNISDEILNKYRAHRLVNKARAKFGDKYNEEMKRRIKVRWQNHVPKRAKHTA